MTQLIVRLSTKWMCRSVAGTPLDLGDDESRVPVLLIQNPGRRSIASPGCGHNLLGCGSGWDIIVPGGWAMAFWIALVYRGARASGLKEVDGSALEQSRLRVPGDYPDTAAGKATEKASGDALEAKHNRIPPAKRPNYVKLGVAAPFRFPWERLVEEWAVLMRTEVSEKSNMEVDVAEEVGKDVAEDAARQKQAFCVCRCRKMLQLLGSLCQPTKNGCDSTPSVALCGIFNQLHSDEAMSRSLVAVQVSFCQVGMPSCFTMICIPTDEDFTSQGTHDVTEPQHKDAASAHKKFLSRKRKLATKANGQANETTPKNELVTDDSQLPTDGVAKSGCHEEHLVGACTRQTIGYITHGNVAFSVGHGHGVGFVAMAALAELLRSQQKVAPPHGKHGCRVLVRSPRSLQYRWACLSVLCDS